LQGEVVEMEPTFKIEIGSHVDMIPLVTCDM